MTARRTAAWGAVAAGTVAAALGAFAAAGAKPAATEEAVPPAPAPVVRATRFPTTFVDLGPRKAAGTIPVAFAYEIGPGGAEFVALRTSCGCLQPRFRPGPRAAGERATVSVELHATGQPEGRKRFQARLTVRDPAEREIVLEAEAVFRSDVRIEPANVIVHLPEPAAAQAGFALRERFPRPLQVLRAECSRPDFAVTRAGGADSHRHEFAVAIPAGLPEGSHDAVVRIVAATAHDPAHAERLEFEIPVRVERPAARRFLPAELVVRRADLTGGVLRVARCLDRTGGGPIRAVRGEHPAVRAELRGDGSMLVTLAPGLADTRIVATFADGGTLALPIRVRE